MHTVQYMYTYDLLTPKLIITILPTSTTRTSGNRSALLKSSLHSNNYRAKVQTPSRFTLGHCAINCDIIILPYSGKFLRSKTFTE